MLCRAADSPLMKNKTPFFSPLCFLLLVVVRSHSFLSPSILFSRSLFWFLLLPYTHTHTLFSSTSSSLFAFLSSVVYVFFTITNLQTDIRNFEFFKKTYVFNEFSSSFLLLLLFFFSSFSAIVLHLLLHHMYV
jgi:hypothetical protein